MSFHTRNKRSFFSIQCLIILTSATPFLRTLLTTTTTIPTHISDFRNLPRSDSRANKPDVFPGFDFIEEPTTVRIITPIDFYTKFIGGIVYQGRHAYEQIVNNLQNYEINRRAKQTTAQKLVYIPAEEIVQPTEKMPVAAVAADDNKPKASKEQNWTKKYFSSLLTAVGFNKLQNASDPEFRSKILATSATYINPLLNLWKTATIKLNSERDTTIPQQHQQYNKSADIESDTYNTPSYPLQFNDSIKTNIVSNPSSLAFRYAFSKYLNLISKGYRHDDENKTISENSKLSGVPLGDVNLNNNNTMGVDVDFPIERIDERTDEDNDDDESNENSNYDAGNFGIFILEIFGTVIGLTWGAFSQLQNLFTQNGK